MNILKAYQVHRPENLSHIIESINFYQNKNSNDMGYISYDNIPDGSFEMVLHNSNNLLQKKRTDSNWKPLTRAFIRGLYNSCYQIKMQPGDKLVIVRFHPGTFKHLYSGKLNQFINSETPLTKLWPNHSQMLINKLERLENDQEITQRIVNFFISKLNKKKRSVIDKSIDEIMNSDGLVHINSLAARSNLSGVHFRKKFREEVGIAPKTFTKIVRIQNILTQMINDQIGSLADITYKFEYFDQSHFTKEFKSVVGQTPNACKKALKNNKSKIINKKNKVNLD